MPKTRREKQAETDAKFMEAAIEGDFATIASMGRAETAKHAQQQRIAQELSKTYEELLDTRQELSQTYEELLDTRQTPKEKEVWEKAAKARTKAQGAKLSKAALVSANNVEIERRKQAADHALKEADRASKEAAHYTAENKRIQSELKEMKDAGMNKDEDLLLSWAEARDLRLGEPVWNLLTTEDIHTTRGKVSVPKGARGTLVATNAATPRDNPDPGRDFHTNRRMGVQFKLRNPVTKRIEPFNVAMYYKLLSHVEPYSDLYLAAEAWCANWSRCHVHWSVLKLKLRCWAWVRRTRIRMGTHRVPSVATMDSAAPPPVKGPVALASELWDHSAQLRVPFGPDDLLFTTFSAECSMDHMLVPCRSLPADVDFVLRRWMYQRRVVVSRAHLESQRNGRSRFDAVLPVLSVWCDEDPEAETSPFEPFYSAAPNNRFKSLEEFATWWDEHVRSMGTVDHGRTREHGTYFNRRFTDASCTGCLSNSYHELDNDVDNDRCPQFRLGELIEAVETKRVVLKVDLSLLV
jgi:hypothetical protein